MLWFRRCRSDVSFCGVSCGCDEDACVSAVGDPLLHHVDHARPRLRGLNVIKTTYPQLHNALLHDVTYNSSFQFALVETVTTSIMDQFPKLRKYKAGVIIGTGVVLFLLGLTMTTNGGVYMLQVMDHYSGGWNVLIIAFVEVVCIGWVYGTSSV